MRPRCRPMAAERYGQTAKTANRLPPADRPSSRQLKWRFRLSQCCQRDTRAGQFIQSIEQEMPVNKPPVHASAHEASAPEPWVTRFVSAIPPGRRVLDLACGGGRHTRFFLEHGHPVTAVDIELGGLAQHAHPQLEAIEADLEHGPWPLEDRRFAAVVVVNYLWRPILPNIIAAVEPGGVLLYATFGRGQGRLGKPTNPDFLLKPGELLEAVHGELTVHAYEYGEIPTVSGHLAIRQHLYARREST